ncbi:MAG: hypothetical protein DWQ06_04250 [Calditrichaeota bacterium]|nr:MAG: hypothetical protein DWQ06_04250 [Calditrichota bacterium]
MKNLKILITVLTLNTTFISIGLGNTENLEFKKKKIVSQIENPFSETEGLKLIKKLEELKKDEELLFLSKNLEKAKLQKNNKLATKLQQAIRTLKLQRQEKTQGLEK